MEHKLKFDFDLHVNKLYSRDSSSNSTPAPQEHSKWPSYLEALRATRGTEDHRKYRSAGSLEKPKIDEVMQEFRMNGIDLPYDPDADEGRRNYLPAAGASGIRGGTGRSTSFLRQSSWPPERTPALRLPRPKSWIPSLNAQEFVPRLIANAPEPALPTPSQDTITAEQLQVLNSLSTNTVHALLKELQDSRELRECRFCKNNGEREMFYRSHTLKDSEGRVTCPILRVFQCKRCRASGDNAHTIKYCPFATEEERIKSAAMMRTIRQTSARRRHRQSYLEPSSSQEQYETYRINEAPLDPLWAALEKKLRF